MTNLDNLFIINGMSAKKVNSINGVKIIRRYSPATIVTIFLTFVLILIPLIQLFFLMFSLEANSSIIPALDSTQNEVSFSGVNIISGLIDLYKKYFLLRSDVPMNDFATYFSKIIDSANSEFGNYGIPIMIGIFMLFLVVELILAIIDTVVFIELLFRGRMNSYKIPKNTALIMFLMQIFLSMFGLVSLVFSHTNLGFEFDVQKVTMPLICLGVSFLDFVIMLIIYLVSFKDGVFVRHISQFIEEQERIKKESTMPVYNQFPTYGNPQHNTYGPFGSGQYQQPQNNDFSQNSNKNNPQPRERKGLPPDLKEIGDQAFNAELNLEVAIIPNTVKSIGASAFANCINLRVVSIPPSVQNIGYNAFFNCYSLKRINFNGTKEEWKKIQRGSNWLTKAGTTSVVCLDGVVIVNPHH